MQLGPGTRLGPYEIVGALGAGGMGEVFRATDTRLGRQVAIKVLSRNLAASPELAQRFEREARAISSLAHPNICALYDVGSIDGVEYIVMELLEGESLAERLARGPLPLSQVLRFGVQISDALDRAHRQNIVHRDLKPGNIMITRGGVKLLDFGLAKPIFAEPADQNAPTIKPLTTEGTILGTVQYMSPEQLEGKPVDSRSDIFALGNVLYEMTTGRRAFQGTSQAGIIAAILHHDPEPLVPMAPAALDRIVRTCLAKDPDDRWQTARDLTLQLQALAENSGATNVAPALLPARRRVSRFLIPLAIGLVAGAALVAPFAFRKRATNATETWLSIVTQSPLVIDSGNNCIAVAPDGRLLLYGTSELRLRSLDDGTDIAVRGTEGASGPFFSADGRSIGFFQSERLKVMNLETGATTTLDARGPGRGAAWSSDGRIAFISIPGGPVQIVSATGGGAKPAAKIEPNEAGHSTPQFLPGGTHLLYTAEVDGKSFDHAIVRVVDLKSGAARTILEGAMAARYAAGHLWFGRGGKLYRVALDPKTLRIEGTPAEVPVSVIDAPPYGIALFDVAEDGTLFSVAGSRDVYQNRVVWIDRQGRKTALALPPGTYASPRVDPTGKRLLIEVVGANDDLWIHDPARGTFTRMTFGDENIFPAWTGDGTHILTGRYRNGPPQLYAVRADGTGEPEQLLKTEGAAAPGINGRDSGKILYAEFTNGGWDIHLLRMPSRKPAPVRVTRFNERYPALSPDGRWVAYSSDETGTEEVYVQPLEGGAGRVKISQDGGYAPLWTRGGREVVFQDRYGLKSVAVEIQDGEVFAKAPATVFEQFQTRSGGLFANYDVSPDGERFVFVENSEALTSLRRIDVVTGLLK